jgi:multiple sugar transport system substrate-binding protein
VSAPRALLVAVGLLLAAACTAERPGGQARLVLRHAKMPGEADPLPALLAEFERRHPGVRVAHEPLPWTADVQHQFFVLNLEGRSAGFDVLMLDVIWVAEFARAGWLLDLSERWPPAERREHAPAAVAAATFDGRVWALPWVMNVGLLYYRADLLGEHGFLPPRTYEALARQAATVRARRPGLQGFLWQGKQYEGLVVNVLESFWAEGTDLLGPDGTVLPDEAAARAALGFRRRLLATGLSPRLVASADEELTRREFGAGRALFLRNWPYARPLFEAPGSPVRGRVGVVPLPGGGALGGAHLAISRATRHPEAAWALAQFLTRPEAQQRIAAATGLHPTRPALLRDPALGPIFAGARPRPVTPWYQTLSATLQPELSAAILGVRPVGDALAGIRPRLRYLLDGVAAEAPGRAAAAR